MNLPIELMLPMLVLAAVIAIRVACLAAHLNRRTWTGPLWRFYGMSGGYAGMAAGALGTALGWLPGPALLLTAVAMVVLAERRIMPRGR